MSGIATAVNRRNDTCALDASHVHEIPLLCATPTGMTARCRRCELGIQMQWPSTSRLRIDCGSTRLLDAEIPGYEPVVTRRQFLWTSSWLKDDGRHPLCLRLFSGCVVAGLKAPAFDLRICTAGRSGLRIWGFSGIFTHCGSAAREWITAGGGLVETSGCSCQVGRPTGCSGDCWAREVTKWSTARHISGRAAPRSIVTAFFHFANPFGEGFRSTRGVPGENGSHARRRPRPVLYCSGRCRGEVLLLPRLMLLVGVFGNFACLTKKRGHRFFCPTQSCPSCHVDLHYGWTARGSLRPCPGPSTKSRDINRVVLSLPQYIGVPGTSPCSTARTVSVPLRPLVVCRRVRLWGRWHLQDSFVNFGSFATRRG